MHQTISQDLTEATMHLAKAKGAATFAVQTGNLTESVTRGISRDLRFAAENLGRAKGMLASAIAGMSMDLTGDNTIPSLILDNDETVAAATQQGITEEDWLIAANVAERIGILPALRDFAADCGGVCATIGEIRECAERAQMPADYAVIAAACSTPIAKVAVMLCLLPPLFLITEMAPAVRRGEKEANGIPFTKKGEAARRPVIKGGPPSEGGVPS